jgi:hypothetical protein
MGPESFSYKITNVPVFDMGLDVLIWMRGYPFLGPFEGVSHESLKFFWAHMELAVLFAISGPKKVLTFRAHLFKRSSLWISPHPNQYVPLCRGGYFLLPNRE